MKPDYLKRFMGVNLWHLTWIAVLISLALTYTLAYLFTGRVTCAALLIGGAVPLLIGVPFTYLVKKLQDLIKERDKKYAGDLEALIAEKTAELTEANAKLEREIKLREKTEGETLRAQKLESIGLLAGGIAHDFNNALTVIQNNISLAKIAENPGKAFVRLDSAENAVRTARSLTKQLLTFSRGGEPVKKTMHISGIVKEAADFALRGSKSKCVFSSSEGLLPVEVDEGQINQAIGNVVINAAQSMEGGGTVEIRAENYTFEKGTPFLKAGKYVRVSIKDHGPGIPEEYITKVFDPYFTTKEKGSGIGLTAAYSIVKKHGGHMTVDTGPGGSTFNIFLPASESMPLEEIEGPVYLAGEGRILLMEDDSFIAESAKELLEKFGYRVMTAANGSEAVELYRKAKTNGSAFDAVILDLTIPGGMGGVETYGRLIGIDPEVKAIVVSGYSNDPVMSRYREFGFMGALNKPYLPLDLIGELKKVLPS